MSVPHKVGWSDGCLADVIANIVAGTSANCEDRPFEIGDRRVLKLSAVSAGRFRPDESKVAARSEHSRLRTPVRSGTVLFTRKNTPELVGDSAYVPESIAGLYLPDLIWELSAVNGIEPRWLNHWLQSPLFRRQIPSLSAGSSQSMVGISQGNLLASPLLIPPRSEQQRIMAVLDAWDRAIDQTERLIAAKRRRHRGLLTKQFFGRNEPTGTGLSLTTQRVAGASGWPLRSIGDFAHEVSLFNRDGQHLPVLSCTKHAGIVLSDDYFSGRRIYSEDTSGYKLVERGQFAYATNHLEEGSIGLQTVVETGLVSPMYTVFDIDDRLVDRRFLITVLKTETYRQVFEINTSSSIDRRGGLRWDEFAALPFALPSLEEQKRIAVAIAALEADLARSIANIAALRRQKRGVMQKLLIGARPIEEKFK